MADPIFGAALEGFQLIAAVLITIGIIINLALRRGNERLLFMLVVIGYYAVIFLVNDFFLATTIIVMWFVATGAEFFLPKEILIVMFALLAVLGYSNPLFFLIASALYLISIANFLSTSYKLLRGAR